MASREAAAEAESIALGLAFYTKWIEKYQKLIDDPRASSRFPGILRAKQEKLEKRRQEISAAEAQI